MLLLRWPGQSLIAPRELNQVNQVNQAQWRKYFPAESGREIPVRGPNRGPYSAGSRLVGYAARNEVLLMASGWVPGAIHL